MKKVFQQAGQNVCPPLKTLSLFQQQGTIGQGRHKGNEVPQGDCIVPLHIIVGKNPREIPVMLRMHCITQEQPVQTESPCVLRKSRQGEFLLVLSIPAPAYAGVLHPGPDEFQIIIRYAEFLPQ